jgi:two-component system chemotaxis response regulator CheB
VADLPANLPAAVFVVIHIPPLAQSSLPHILSRAGRLLAMHALDDDPIRLGRIVIAPPDTHLLIGRSRVHLSLEPPERGHRPSANLLFHSAALNHGARVIGVVLSGLLGDGAAGLAGIVRRGGAGVVQDPSEAEFSGMPRRAIDLAAPQRVVKVAEMADAIIDALAGDDHSPPRPVAATAV